MATIKEVCNFLESTAPLSYQESYDNAGLLVGSPYTEVQGVLICLDSTEEVIDEAIRQKCNLVIAHHPIIFSGLKKLNGKNYVERTIIKAIKNDIAIYAAHTNFDNVLNGVNLVIANKLGLKNCKILSPKSGLLKKLVTFCPIDKALEVRQALFDAGAGYIGNYDHCSFNSEGVGTFRGPESTNPYVGEKGKDHQEKELKIETIYPVYKEPAVLSALLTSHPYEEVAYDIYMLENQSFNIGAGMIGELSQEMDELSFLNLVKVQMGAKGIRYTRFLGGKVKKIAICGGSGSFLLPEAIKAGADMFITADFKYHQFFDADNKIVIADIGHYESEQFTQQLFHERITGKFPTFAVHLSKINTNPINYL